eukprot:92853_1
MQWLNNGKWKSQKFIGKAYCERHDGKHPNRTLWSKAMKYCADKNWGNATKSLSKLLTNHPHYYATCIHNFTYSIYRYIEQLLIPYREETASNMTARGFKKLSEISPNTFDMHLYYGGWHYNAKKLRKDKNRYKLIISYHKRWIHIVKKSKKYTDNKTYVSNRKKAYQVYTAFLKGFSNNRTHISRHMVTLCKLLNTFQFTLHLQHIHWCICVGYLKGALNIIHCIKYKMKQKNMTFQNISFRNMDKFAEYIHVLLSYFHCYILNRFEQYQEALNIWSKIETEYEFDFISNTLFASHYLNDKGIRNETALIFNCCGITLPNTSVLDLKMKYLFGVKQPKQAMKVWKFYDNLWNNDDQVWCYKAFWQYNMGFYEFAKYGIDHLGENVDGFEWKKNQHFLAALIYHQFKDYKHAKHHFVGCIVHEKFKFPYDYEPKVAEYYYYFAKTLMVSGEYKLAKYFLNKGFKITPDIPCIQQNFARMNRKLNKKLNDIQCSNNKCDKTYYYYSRNTKQNLNVILKICGGCGKKYYCSKKCQKYDWKRGKHRNLCDGTWRNLFKMIKTNIWIDCSHYQNVS